MSLGNVTGEPILAVVEGKEYKVGLVTQAAKGQLERILEKRTRDAVLAGKDQLTDEEFKLAYAAFLDKVGSGDFSYGGPTFRRWIDSGLGTLAMVQVLFGVSADEAERLVAQGPAEVSAALRSVFAASFPQAPAAG